MKKFIFSISSKIAVEGETNSIELTTIGNYCRVNGKWVMMYEEPLEEKNGNIRTVIRATDDLVSITRNGDTSSRLIMKLHERNMCHYNTEYGAIMMGVYCTDIKTDLNEAGGIINMSYTLDVNAAVFSKNEVTIKVREVKTNVKNG